MTSLAFHARRTAASLACASILAGCGATQPPTSASTGFPGTHVATKRAKGDWKTFPVIGYPQGIVRLKNGDFWIADGDMTQTLSRLTPRGKVTYYTIGYVPLEMALDSIGNLWLTVAQTLNVVIRVSPSLQVKAYALADDTSGGIIAGGDGNIWFVQNTHVGEITPAGQITEYATPQVQGSSGITWAPNGLLWFETTEGLTSLDPASGDVQTYNTPDAKGGAVVATSDGTLWYLLHFTGAVTLINFDPATQEQTSYTAPPNFDPYGAPAGMILGPDGSLWYTVQRLSAGSGKRVVGGGVVRFNLKSKRFTTYATPKGYGWDWDIATGPRGTLWATAGFSVAELNPR